MAKSERAAWAAILACAMLLILAGVFGSDEAPPVLPQPTVVDMTEGLTPAEQASADVVHEQWLKSQENLRPSGEVAEVDAPDVDFDRPSGGDGWDINWCRRWWC